MRKRIGLTSIIVFLMLLLITQTMFFTNVSSTTLHTGDADVGDFWVSEMDVTDVVNSYDNIGVAHANASDDNVLWSGGRGKITADWEVSLSSNHPEYYIIYELCIYHINNDNAEIGNITHSGIYAENTSYDTGGILEIPIIFDLIWQQEPQTLVCELYASVIVLNTAEAKNFTTVALDRSVVQVSFIWSHVQPFVDIKDGANDNFPGFFSYIDGWEQKFRDEREMLNEQTIAVAGEVCDSIAITYGDWNVADLTVRNYPYDFDPDVELENTSVIPHWRENYPDFAIGKIYMDYDIWHYPYSKHRVVKARLKLFHDEDDTTAGEINLYKHWWYNGTGQAYGGAAIYTEYQDENHWVYLHGCAWARCGGFYDYLGEELDDYKVKIDPNGKNEPWQGNTAWRWQGACAYMEGSYTVTISGSSVIMIDISEGLQSENEFIITNAADRGDTTILLYC